MKSIAKIIFLAMMATACSQKAPEPQAEAPAPAMAPMPAKLEIQEPWAAITPKGAKVGGGYLTIVNPGEADRLLSAASPRAKKVEIHEMKMDGNMMTMHPIDGLDVPAGDTVKLEKGGYHLMFTDIDAPFVAGQDVAVTLTFQKAGAVDVALKVSDAAPAAASAPAADSVGGMKMEKQ